jgi:hypothetical protein
VNRAGLGGSHIGVIQSVREIPGFLALSAVYVIMVIKEHHLAALSIFILGAGVAATGLGPSFAGLILTTLVMSFGFHYYETLGKSLTLQYFDVGTAPRVFGRLRALSAASNIGIGVVIFLIAPVLNFTQIYLLIGGLIALTGLWSLTQDPSSHDAPLQHKKMVFRRKYWLFYLLTFLAGARRQIFVAFAVFLLVKKFHFSVQEITALFVINNLINYFISPMIGKGIIKYGERKVLSLEYTSLIFIFMAYAVVDSKALVSLLYILDHIFFNFHMAIGTYFQKVSDPGDIAPSVAMGSTINHIAAVVLPVTGGLLWMIDYRIPFLAGAGLAVASLTAAQWIRTPAPSPRQA